MCVSYSQYSEILFKLGNIMLHLMTNVSKLFDFQSSMNSGATILSKTLHLSTYLTLKSSDVMRTLYYARKTLLKIL